MGLDAKTIRDVWENKGDIVLENDVWIGYEAVMLSGVHWGSDIIGGALRSAGLVFLHLPRRISAKRAM